jgi:uncharacterized sulfatase
LYGIDENGVHHSEWAFTDIDAAPSKSYLIENWQDETVRPYFDWAHAKRPEFDYSTFKMTRIVWITFQGSRSLRNRIGIEKCIDRRIEKVERPACVGPVTNIRSYVRYSPIRRFPKPENIQQQK